MKEIGIKGLQQYMQRALDLMQQSGKLFVSSFTGREVWETYMAGLAPDPIFRDPNSSEHNCNLCNNFIRRYGNIVSVEKDGQLCTIWDCVPLDSEYGESAKNIINVILNKPIQDVFFETYNSLNSLNYEKCKKTNSVFRLGIAQNTKRYTKEEAEKFGVVKPEEIRVFNHLYLDIQAAYVLQTDGSIEAIQGRYRDARNVFHRALTEISKDTLMLVRDLIKQGSLLDGDTHLKKVEIMLKEMELFENVKEDKDNYTWLRSHGLPIAKFRNELIGVLCVELSEGMDLNQACLNWNKRADPANYMKATAPITKKQIEEAKKFVEANGYEQSFDRRHATIDDIKASEILHLNSGDGSIAKVSIFDNVKATSTRHKRSEFDKVEEVPVEKFMRDILPTCTSVEVFLTAKHEKNMVSLTAPVAANSKPIFKWGNMYSWTYKGNLAGVSQITEAVKEKGGITEAPFRVSLIWNESGQDQSDLDLHLLEPRPGYEIHYAAGFRRDRGNKFTTFGGQLDLDNTNPGSKVGVENIYYLSTTKMPDGVYAVVVNQYSARNSKGFKAEIIVGEESYIYTYDKPLRGSVKVADVYCKNGEFTVKHLLPVTGGENRSMEIYGLDTGAFHRANLVCLSPNHWGENAVGNKHYFFMLNGCATQESIRGFHVENLSGDLLEHRKVMEVLGNTTMVEPSATQLSGLGFNATVRDEVILKLGGSHKRVIKVKF